MSLKIYPSDATTHIRHSSVRHSDFEEQKQRNLVNQRNFRSRRKQYVMELEQKIREYQQAGVTATKQVQAAARAVADENIVLRDLIKTRLEWSEQRLACYISQARNHVQNQSCNSNHHSKDYSQREPGLEYLENSSFEHQVSNSSQPRPITQHVRDLRDHLVYERTEPTLRPTRPSQANVLEVRRSSFTSQTCAPLASQGDSSPRNPVHQKTTFPEAQPDIAMFDRTADHQRSDENTVSGSCMSCEQAATILSDLRAQQSVDLIREELGCASLTTCQVTHEELFRKMDDAV